MNGLNRWIEVCPIMAPGGMEITLVSFSTVREQACECTISTKYDSIWSRGSAHIVSVDDLYLLYIGTVDHSRYRARVFLPVELLV